MRSGAAIVVAIVVVRCVRGGVRRGQRDRGRPSTTPAAAQAQPRRVLVYGDSLTWEAQAGIEQAIEAQLPGWDAIVRTSPGVATCDALPAMRGPTATSTPAWWCSSTWRCRSGRACAARTRSPSTRPTPRPHSRCGRRAACRWCSWARRGGSAIRRDPIGAAAINRDLAARSRPDVRRRRGAAARSVDRRVPATAPVPRRRRRGAGAAVADGLIDVRDESGGHFCAIHNVGPCPVYASGIVRFAAPIADAVARAAGTARWRRCPVRPRRRDVQNVGAGLFVGSRATRRSPTSRPARGRRRAARRRRRPRRLCSAAGRRRRSAATPLADAGVPE